MKILVTDYDHDNKMQAIKGLRLVAKTTDLKAVKDFIDGSLPAEFECRGDFSWQAIRSHLATYGVVAQLAGADGIVLAFLANLPAELTVGHLRSTLNALGSFGLE